MKTNIQKFTSVLCVLGVAFIFTACEDFFPSRVSYTFDNQSSHAVSVTLGDKFQQKIGESYVDSYTQELTLYSNSSKEVFTESTSVDFSWTAYNESDNQKITCVVDRNKATFKNR